jgi:hypothetical protein
MVCRTDGCSVLAVGVGRTLTWESDEAAAPDEEKPLEEGPEREGAAVPPKWAKRWASIHPAR